MLIYYCVSLFFIVYAIKACTIGYNGFYNSPIKGVDARIYETLAIIFG
jgi:hypothetical protein